MRFYREEQLVKFYGCRVCLLDYPLLETSLTKEDNEIWKGLPKWYSCLGNVVLETRDAEWMSALEGGEPIVVGDEECDALSLSKS